MLACVIMDVIYLSERCYNSEVLVYTDDSNKNFKNVLPANLVQTGSVHLFHFTTYAEMYHKQYILLIMLIACCNYSWV